jgi:hypothetical protein
MEIRYARRRRRRWRSRGACEPPLRSPTVHAAAMSSLSAPRETVLRTSSGDAAGAPLPHTRALAFRRWFLVRCQDLSSSTTAMPFLYRRQHHRCSGVLKRNSYPARATLKIATNVIGATRSLTGPKRCFNRLAFIETVIDKREDRHVSYHTSRLHRCLCPCSLRTHFRSTSIGECQLRGRSQHGHVGCDGRQKQSCQSICCGRSGVSPKRSE